MKTESKRAEEKLRLRESFLSAITENQPGLLWLKDAEGRFLMVNKAFATACGRGDPEQVHGLTDVDIWPEEMAQKYRHDDQRVMSSGKSSMVEEMIFVGDHRVWYETFKTPVRDDKGRVIGTTGYAHDITERKRMEEQLAESGNFLNRIINSIADPILVKDRQHRWVLLNDAHNKLFGRSSQELLGKTDHDFFPKSEADVFWSKDEAVFTTGAPNINEEKWTDAKGNIHTIVTKKTLYTNEKGEKFIVGIIRDITERKRAAEAQSESEGHLQSILGATADGILAVDNQGKVIKANQRFAELWRIPQPVLDSRDDNRLLDYILGQLNEPEAFLAKVKALYKSDQEDTDLLNFKDGRMFERFSCPLKRDGAVVGRVWSFRDVTERKRAEKALRNSRALYSSLVENLPQNFFRKDCAGRFTFVNEQACREMGHSLEDIIGKTDADFFPPELVQAYRKDDLRVMETGQTLNQEEKHMLGGREVFVQVIKTPTRDSQGRIIGTQGVYWDITERKQAEERLREQAALLDAANDAIYVRALDHTVTYWNDGAERLYGWTRAEALGRKMPELGDLGHEIFEAAHAVLLEQGSWSGELKKRNKAGKEMTVFCRWTMLKDERGRPKEILAINTDVTERKQLEANFLRAQRMEGIGALAGGIAHDINNILQPILMTAPLLRETTGDPESRKMLDTVESCAQRGADIIKQLLTFARGTPGVRVPLPVRHLLRDMDKIIRETFPRNIELNVDAPKDLWPVMGDATQIHQALMNLCVNARDAMPEGGALTLTAKNLTLDEAFVAMMPGTKPGLHVCVSVTDTGTGIPPELVDRIFDPFFTTKEIGKGTGLGLATVLGIVRGHGGSVRVNSRIGKGTTFELYLPASPETKAVARPGCETLPPRAGGELILVVDDETSVCGVIRVTLEKHGYRVMTAAEGSEAIRLFVRHRTEVKVIITDMMMPGMDGPSLIRALRHMEPRLPILGMTGMGEKADIKGLETLGLPVLLTKPFDSTVLLGVLHQALAAPDNQAKGKP